MTDYILITSVTAEKLFGVFEESVRETCAKDYSAVQIDAWIARATPARPQASTFITFSVAGWQQDAVV